MAGVSYSSSPRYQEDVTVADDLTVSGSVTVGEASQINATLTVTGDTNVSGGMVALGSAKISGGVTTNEASQINATLTVTGDTNVSGGMIANGASQINATLTVTGDSKVSGGLTVVGATSFTNTEEEFIPIDWAEDGSSAPAASTTFTSGSATVQIRKFDDAAVEDVVIPWEIPRDIVTADGVKFQVIGYITESTAPAAGEGVSFKMSGYSVGDSDSADGTFGTEVESNYADLDGHASGDRFATTLSNKVTVTNLARGETAMLHLERDTADADDDYGQDVGVVGIKLIYTKQFGV